MGAAISRAALIIFALLCGAYSRAFSSKYGTSAMLVCTVKPKLEADFLDDVC